MNTQLLRFCAICAIASATAIPVAAATVTLVDHKGKPVPKAEVVIHSDYRGRNDHKTVRSDRRGRFSVNGQAIYSVRAEGYSFATGWTDPAEKKKSVKMVLWPEGKLKGRVVDEQGKPLSGVTVRLTSAATYGRKPDERLYVHPSPSGPEQKWYRRTTSGNGTFVLPHLPSPGVFSGGHVDLEIRKPGRAVLNVRLNIQQIAKSYNVTLPREARMAGHVYLPGKSGVAPPEQQITVRMDGQEDTNIRGTSTDRSGGFSLSGLSPGKVDVFVTVVPPRDEKLFEQLKKGGALNYVRPIAPWVAPAIEDVELLPGQTTTLDIVLLQGALLKGSVVDQATGKPATGGSVSIESEGMPDFGYRGYVEIDKQGNFQTRVAPGEVRIRVTGASFAAGRPPSYFSEDDGPSVKLTVADGEEKSDIVLQVAETERYYGMDEQASKPIPPGFSLVSGTYKLAWDPDIKAGEDYMDIEDAPTRVIARIKKLPPLVSSKPQKTAYPLDGTSEDGFIAAVFDESKGTGKGYDTAYLDINRNWDLSDDKPFTWKPDRDPRLDWVSVPAHQGMENGARTDHSIQVRLSVNNYGERFSSSLARKGAWKGTMLSNKGKIECVTTDSNSNGSYGDRTKIDKSLYYEGRDYLFADTNGYGHVVIQTCSPHAIALNEVVRLAGKFYRIQVNDVGDEVTVEDYIGPFGAVALKLGRVAGLKSSVSNVVISTPVGYYEFKNVSKPMNIPAGIFKVYSSDMLLTVNKKKRLSMTCSTIEPSKVSAGKQTTAEIGGDVYAAISPKVKDLVLPARTEQKVDWLIRAGKTGRLESISYKDQDESPTIVKFFSAGGKLLRKGELGYT